MNIVQITPGAGGMYCGGCFRDNALVAEWRRCGHNAIMLPLYLPMTLDEEDQSRGAPMFFGGINVYLEQKCSWFSKLPRFVHRFFDSPALLRRAAGSAAKTRPSDVGALTLSMLKGEEGRQARELEEMTGWLKTHFKPDAICLSDALLIGMARRLKSELTVPVLCLLGGEDSFLNSLPESHRAQSWTVAQERARDVDCFIAPSQYFADLMEQRLKLRADQVQVIYGGINLTGYQPRERLPDPPVVGYFARMCKEKGLPALIDAFIQLKQRNRIPKLQLHVGGGLSPVDEANLVKPLKARLRQQGLWQDVQFLPNLSRAEKLAFYRRLSVLSVPALYGESFGLYLVEAWASGVPVVQPRHAAFPELIQTSGAGVLYDPEQPFGLTEALENILLSQERLLALGQAGCEAARRQFSIAQMAEKTLALVQGVAGRQARVPRSTFEPAAHTVASHSR